MKKTGLFLTVILGATMASSAAHAQYGMAGCGLGSVLFGSDDGVLMQVLAATTNGTFGNQTFGMTSGTLNCAPGGAVAANKEQIAFAEVNFQDLKRNMATGGGEYVSTFATLLGCQEAAKPAFAKLTQDRFEAIFPNSATSPGQMLETVKGEVATAKLDCSDDRAIARAEGKQIQLAQK